MTTIKDHFYWLKRKEIQQDEIREAVKTLCKHHGKDFEPILNQGTQLSVKLRQLPKAARFATLENLSTNQWIALAVQAMVANTKYYHWRRTRGFMYKMIHDGFSHDLITPKQAEYLGLRIMDRWGWDMKNFHVEWVTDEDLDL